MAASVCVRLSGSNSPCEDRYSIRTSSKAQNIEAFLVIDGHGGNLAADITCANLLDMVFERLEEIPKEVRRPERVVEILDTCFVECDKMVLDEAMRIKTLRENQRSSAPASNSSSSSVLTEKFPTGRPPNLKPTGRAGCCALVLLILDGLMYMAHVGDCRAMLVFDGSQTSEPPKKKAKLERTEYNESVTGDLASALDTKSGFYCHDSFLESKLGAICSPNGSNRGYSRDHIMKVRQESGNYYIHRNCKKGLEVSAVTLDHCCDSSLEVQAVRAQTDDTNPIRRSINAQKGSNSRMLSSFPQPLRVAGSLAVTRALGDGYLKMRSLSVRPYRDHCPYITCRPTISWREIRETDQAIILASDGLYNFVNSEEIASVMESLATRWRKQNSHMTGNSLPENLDYRSHAPQALSVEEGYTFVPVEGSDKCNLSWNNVSSSQSSNRSVENENEKDRDDRVFAFKSSPNKDAKNISASEIELQAREGTDESDCMDPAERLLEICFKNAAVASNTSVEKLKSMVSGEARRSAIDDVTVMVVQLNQNHKQEKDNVTISTGTDTSQTECNFVEEIHRKVPGKESHPESSQAA